MADASFGGFTPKAATFLRGLAAHNDRAWFVARKGTYESEVLAPMRELLLALAPAMLAIDPGFETNPRSGAVSRIYRDTRFSHDKSPYRVNQWIAFRHRAEDWPSRPAFFMEFGADHYRYGMGFYAAPPVVMAAVRTRIAARPEPFVKAMARAGKAGFVLEGDVYKRPQVPPDLPEAVQEWYRRKNAYLTLNHAMDAAFCGPALLETVQEAFRTLTPLYRVLAAAREDVGGQR